MSKAELTGVTSSTLLLALGLLGGCSSDFAGPDAEFEANLEVSTGSECGQRQSHKRELVVELLGRYSTGLVGLESSGETAALKDDRLYVTSAEAVSLDVVDVSNPRAPTLLERVDLASYGASVQSVDVSSRGLVAVAVAGAARTDPGTIVFLNKNGRVLRTAAVGALPDMVVFTHDGKKLVVANEGEPGCYGEGCVDPEGSVSIVDVSLLRPVLPVQSVSFTGVPIPAGVRVFGPGATPAQDLEPEGLTISNNDRTAYVTLQENNAIAVIDLKIARVVEIRPLGYKDLATTGGLDASDRDGVINIRNWPVYGMYQPDAISSFRACGNTYLVTANEGDARDYDGFAEEARARSIGSLYPSIPEVTDDLQLGRLTVTTAPPDGDLSRPYVFGTRSFSLWNADSGAQVWDSGAEFEMRTAAAFPAFFNSNNDANDFDTRSDNKGPEPEGVAVGQIGGRTYAFVALERIGGVMIYDVGSGSPAFVQYLNPRDFSSADVGPDSGPEIVRFIPVADSPIRAPLLVVSNEITGTVSLWRLDLK